MSMKWKQVIVLITALGIVSTAGCSSSKPTAQGSLPAASKAYSFAFANVSDKVAAFIAIENGYKRAAAFARGTLKTYDNAFSGQAVVNNAQLIAEQKPDLAFEFNPAPGAGSAVKAIFSRARIPCLALDVPVPGCKLLTPNVEQAGIDLGNIAAAEARKRGWNGSNTVVIVVQASIAGNLVNEGPRIFYQTIADSLPGFTKQTAAQITASTTSLGGGSVQVDGGGTVDGAFTAVQNALASIPASKHIILTAENDDATVGAWQAVVRAGRQGHAMAAGAGGSPDALRLLRTDPGWIAEGESFIGFWGFFGVAAAIYELQGHKLPVVTYMPAVALTKANMSTYIAPDGSVRKLPPLPQQTQYLAGTPLVRALLTRLGSRSS